MSYPLLLTNHPQNLAGYNKNFISNFCGSWISIWLSRVPLAQGHSWGCRLGCSLIWRFYCVRVWRVHFQDHWHGPSVPHQVILSGELSCKMTTGFPRVSDLKESVRAAHIQWLNKALIERPRHFTLTGNTSGSLLGWPGHCQACTTVQLFPLASPVSSSFLSWELIPSEHFIPETPYSMQRSGGEVVRGALFPFLSFLSVLVSGDSKFPFLIQYFLLADRISRPMDWKGQSPLSHKWPCYTFPKLAAVSWPYI